MATQVQFRRGTAAQNNNFTGAEGELSVNLSNYSLRLHDGATAGGYEIARKDFSNVEFGATVLPSSNTSYNLGSSAFKFLNVFSQEFTGDLTGNADTATALETARTINGVSFDGTADITIEASIDKTLFISEGLEDTGGLTSFDGGTDVTLRLKNAPNFSDTNLLKWDNTNEQFVDSILTDNGTTVTATGNLTITGDLLVQGATTTISTTNLEVTDKLIIIGDGTTTTQAADGAGFNIGTSGVSLTYDLANTSWTSSESFNLATGKTYKIAGTTVIGSTSLGSGIVDSSLTSVGTLTSLDVSGATNLQGSLNTICTATFSSNVTMQGNTYHCDSDYGFYGASNDLVVGHTGTFSVIHEQLNTLKIIASRMEFVGDNTNETLAVFQENGSTELRYDNLQRIVTNPEGNWFGEISQIEEIRHRDNNAVNVADTVVERIVSSSTMTIDSWSWTAYSSAEYTVSSVMTNDNRHEITKVLVMANTSGDIWISEQNTISSDINNRNLSISAVVSGGSILVQATPQSGQSDTKIKKVRYYR